MAEVHLNTIFQFKRGLSEAWQRVNPVLRPGEPGYELDTGKLKIGNGETAWNDLEYYGGEFKIAVDGKSVALSNDQLALYGFDAAEAGQTIRKAEDGTLEWYTPVTQEDIDKIHQILEDLEDVDDQIIALNKEIERIDATALTVEYEVTDVPVGTLIDYRDKEIRIMCPENTTWMHQAVGTNGDPNMYYMTFKAYAPMNAVTFKEGDRGVIIDEVFDFNGPASGIDSYGRKYSVLWLALASYNETTGEWTYFGKNSTAEKYIGWDYCVEWYDENGVKLDYSTIRINLSNENCHYIKEDYYMNAYQKKDDLITLDRLINAKNGEPVIFDGGLVEE